MTPAAMRRHLATLPAALAGTVSAALDEVASAVADEARRRVGSAAVAAAVTSGRDDADRAVVSVATPVAGYLEYGTRRVAARPFLRPAVAATSDAAGEMLADAVRQAVRTRGGP